MAELKSLTYEQARKDFFELEMQKAETRMLLWQSKIEKARSAMQEMEAHDNASNAGWEYNFYNDALEALENQPKWISVGERLPERHGQKCVGLYSQHGDDKPYPFPFVFTWYAYGDNGYVNGPHFSDEGLDGLKVHYWMPLPEPPEVGAKRCT